MKKLNRGGTVSFEFVMVAVPFFVLMFAVFDLGRYAITQQSLRLLADAGARAMMINCYSVKIFANLSPSGCTTPTDPLPGNGPKQAVAPFLYAGGLTPTLAVTSGTNVLIVTASLPNFAPLMPIFGTTLNAPSASTSVPF